jgi:hypothetical protein
VIAAHHDVGAGHCDRDADAELLPLVLAPVRTIDPDIAALDPWIDPLELPGPAMHAPIDGGSTFQVSKRSVQ